MRHVSVLSAAALAASLPLCAQQRFTLKHIVIQGDTPYTSEQLQQASGLTPGQTFTSADLTAAAQKLMDSGAIRDVDPSLDGPMSGITAILKVTAVAPTDLLPTAIDNLVWLDPKEVSAELHRRVPMYAPRLPQAGNLSAQTRDALQAMLAEKGVTYKVEAVDTPSTDTAPETLHFRINTPQIVLKSVRLDGLTAETAPPLRDSLRGVVGKPYDESSGEDLDSRLLTPFRNTGYLDATVSNLARTAQPEQAGIVNVVISGTVHPGNPYHVSSITYTGAPLYPADAFATTQKLHNGDVASQAALRATYEPILDAYHDRGYIDARVDTAPQLDSAAHTVAYTISVVPGQPYTVSAVHVDGLSGQVQSDFDKNWQLKKGTIYNASYPKSFLRANSAMFIKQQFAETYDTKADPATHTVEVFVHFFPIRNE